MDFAFFAINLHYTLDDYKKLTPRQKMFIYKAYENKIMSDIGNMYHACFTAFYNVNRPKRKKALKLFRKSKTKQASIQERIEAFELLETTNDDAWLKFINQQRK